MTDQVLLDTHAFLWWVTDDDRLEARLRDRIRAAESVFVSAATAWEIRTKHRLGKLPDAASFVDALDAEERRRARRVRDREGLVT